MKITGAVNVFLSSPAVSARIERLEKEEIIEGYEVKINQLKLGYHITAFINLEVAPVQKPDFYPFIKSCPNVVECNCVTGNYSMLLKVMFPSTMELDTFIGQLQKFGRTSTQIVFSTPVAPRGIDVNQEMPTPPSTNRRSAMCRSARWCWKKPSVWWNASGTWSSSWTPSPVWAAPITP